MCPLHWWFGGYARPAGAWRKRPWLNGESTCLRSRGLQVRVLPGVLCPKQKRAMRRDVAPEKAGSSPAGHPTLCLLHPCGSDPTGRGIKIYGSGSDSLEPHRRTRL